MCISNTQRKSDVHPSPGLRPELHPSPDFVREIEETHYNLVQPVDYMAEIDAVHSSVISGQQPPLGGLTTTFMQRVGGEGSKIDYAALRAEVQMRRRTHAAANASPRTWRF